MILEFLWNHIIIILTVVPIIIYLLVSKNNGSSRTLKEGSNDCQYNPGYINSLLIASNKDTTCNDTKECLSPLECINGKCISPDNFYCPVGYTLLSNTSLPSSLCYQSSPTVCDDDVFIKDAIINTVPCGTSLEQSCNNIGNTDKYYPVSNITFPTPTVGEGGMFQCENNYCVNYPNGNKQVLCVSYTSDPNSAISQGDLTLVSNNASCPDGYTKSGDTFTCGSNSTNQGNISLCKKSSS